MADPDSLSPRAGVALLTLQVRTTLQEAAQVEAEVAAADVDAALWQLRSKLGPLFEDRRRALADELDAERTRADESIASARVEAERIVADATERADAARRRVVEAAEAAAIADAERRRAEEAASADEAGRRAEAEAAAEASRGEAVRGQAADETPMADRMEAARRAAEQLALMQAARTAVGSPPPMAPLPPALPPMSNGADGVPRPTVAPHPGASTAAPNGLRPDLFDDPMLEWANHDSPAFHMPLVIATPSDEGTIDDGPRLDAPVEAIEVTFDDPPVLGPPVDAAPAVDDVPGVDAPVEPALTSFDAPAAFDRVFDTGSTGDLREPEPLAERVPGMVEVPAVIEVPGIIEVPATVEVPTAEFAALSESPALVDVDPPVHVVGDEVTWSAPSDGHRLLVGSVDDGSPWSAEAGARPMHVVIDADSFAKAFAAALAPVLEAQAERAPAVVQPAVAAPPPAKQSSFWSHAWHPDVLLSALAMVIVIIVLIAWVG